MLAIAVTLAAKTGVGVKALKTVPCETAWTLGGVAVLCGPDQPEATACHAGSWPGQHHVRAHYRETENSLKNG